MQLFLVFGFYNSFEGELYPQGVYTRRDLADAHVERLEKQDDVPAHFVFETQADAAFSPKEVWGAGDAAEAANNRKRRQNA